MRIIVAILLLLPCSFFAQTVYPDYSPAFLQNEVAEIRLTMHPDSLALMLVDNDPDNTHEYPAQFSYSSSVLSESVASVGVRLRGNTSLNAQKKSFKVSFNSFVNNQQWQGLEKMNLNANTNDPSLMRAKLVWDFMRFEGLPASRTSHVKVFINDEYRGVYLNVEHIDEEFADRFYDDGTGNLWKCLYPADLDYLGSNPDAYKIEQFGIRTYDLHTNTFQDNYAQLAQFIQVINNTSVANMPCELEQIFNIENYIKYLAIDVLTGNWDGYAFNKNNFYLYHNEHSGLMEFLPYDLDNTLGIDWVGTDWTTRNIYNWKPSGQDRPLYSLVMNVPEYRARFSYYVQLFISNYFNSSGIVNHAQEIQSLISDAIALDSYYSLDNGYTHTDFLEAIDQAWGAQVDYSISDYVEARSNSALNQLQNPSIVDGLIQFEIKQYTDHSIRINAVIRNSGENWVVVFRNNTSGVFSSYLLQESTLFYALDEHLFTILVTDLPSNVSYEVSVMPEADFSLANPTLPCVSQWVHTGTDASGLVINELMPANSSAITDQQGDADDWIEVYNSSLLPINLGNRYLTDDPDNWNKWPLPQMTLNAGDYLLIWADNEPTDGFNHAEFKLDATGETVVLWRQLNNAPMLIDSITFPSLGSDVSLGRQTDGNANWIVFTQSTPDASNGISAVNDSEEKWTVFPNPTADVLYFSQLTSGRLYSNEGRMVKNWTNQKQIDLSDIAAGVYYVSNGTTVQKIIVSR